MEEVINSGRLRAREIDDSIQTYMTEKFVPVSKCWVCGNHRLEKVERDYLDFSGYAEQDEQLNSYTGCEFWLMRCRDCGFIQPELLPTLPDFFERMYDQRWSEEWIEQEFHNGCKDYIFRQTLGALAGRVRGERRRLLDIGAHVGRLLHLAREADWEAEGVELNPRTSSFAQRQTGLPVHRVNARELAAAGHLYDAVTMIDVLEHIPHPLAMLSTVNQLLGPGGWLAVKVPCGPNQILKERWRARLKRNYKFSVATNLVHIGHFSAASLRLALEKAGFSSISIHLGAPELSPRNIARTKRALGGDLLRKGVYALGRSLPGGIHTPLALNLQAYAQKARRD